ncbi:hypothetical protein LCGC14_0920730 [marine sediment metagenome]|uniref:Uncharacterized protein n=1 Tax=marine sediment metagenome TaxID=412755 RepID=A0A0F9PBK0_9ZZZZ
MLQNTREKVNVASRPNRARAALRVALKKLDGLDSRQGEEY